MPEEVKPGVKNVEGKTWAELVAVVLIRGAVEGNSAHLKELLERMEGKVTQPLRAEMSPEAKAYLDAQRHIGCGTAEVSLLLNFPDRT